MNRALLCMTDKPRNTVPRARIFRQIAGKQNVNPRLPGLSYKPKMIKSVTSESVGNDCSYRP